MSKPRENQQVVRYAVVGLGHIAQNAVLPAFKNATSCRLTALVSDDPVKLEALGRRYKAKGLYGYDQYEACLENGDVDAVYIALPNHLHAEYTIRAAERGRHVLCEKPMAVNEMECEQMIDAARRNDVRLMIAYRLHFDEANLSAIERGQSDELGDLRIFNSVFCRQVKSGDIRVQAAKGGGTLYDIGIYCINAARYLFGDEPEEVFAFSQRSDDSRFREIDEMTGALLRFPGERLASFVCSFGASEATQYQVIGTAGDLRVEEAYEYSSRIKHFLTKNGKTHRKTFARRDQFGAELDYFARCIQEGCEPEPSGIEGLADVRIIEALYRSASEGRPIQVAPVYKPDRPTLDQEMRRSPVSEPQLVHTESPMQ